jgi:hypothetical protein
MTRNSGNSIILGLEKLATGKAGKGLIALTGSVAV